MSDLYNPPHTAQRIIDQYKQAHVDYSIHFLQLYISYNAWYREATSTSNDREALSLLKKRFIIWDDYCKGKTLLTLRSYMKQLVEFSHQYPLISTRLYWSGEFQDSNDWRSLIEFWYQVRCLIVHGSPVRRTHVWFAYETLSIFMGEIITRMQTCFNQEDFGKLHELSSIADDVPHRSEHFKKIQHQLYRKYIASSDIWQVDMKRVENE
jgi:hypothetical protein